MREALLFCFNLKKSTAELHRILVKAYGDNALSETTSKGFAGSLPTILTWVTRSVKIGLGRTVNCKLFWTRTISNRKKCLPSNWVFLKQPFSCGYMPWGRFKRSENGCRMNWTIGRWSGAKTHAKFCLPTRQKRKSFLHRIVTSDEKCIFFQNPKRKKSWIEPNHQHLPQDRFGRKTMLCIWWDQEGVIYYELLKPGKTVNTNRHHQQLIKLHRALREKRPYYRKRHDKLIFLHYNVLSHTSTMVQNYLETLNWEVLPHPAYSPDLAPSDYHLFSSMVTRSLNGTSILKKMAWLLVCLERNFLAWYTQIARKMGKMYS